MSEIKSKRVAEMLNSRKEDLDSDRMEVFGDYVSSCSALEIAVAAEQDTENRAIRAYCNVCGTKSLCVSYYDSQECAKLMFFERRLRGVRLEDVKGIDHE